MNTKLIIREIEDSDVDVLAETFSTWHKTWEFFAAYLNMHIKGERFVIVAHFGEKAVGYCTITWESFYQHFKDEKIPEIVDLNVIDDYQGRGIAKELILFAEKVMKQKGNNISGISCAPSEDYASPYQIYLRAGYAPDGFGITDYDGEIHLIKVPGT